MPVGLAYTLDAVRFREIMRQAVLQAGYIASDMPMMVSETLGVDTWILEKLRGYRELCLSVVMNVL